MLARLGDVLYWLGNGLTAVIVGIAAWHWTVELSTGPNGMASLALYAVIAAIIWLIGRSCRYVLSGK